MIDFFTLLPIVFFSILEQLWNKITYDPFVELCKHSLVMQPLQNPSLYNCCKIYRYVRSNVEANSLYSWQWYICVAQPLFLIVFYLVTSSLSFICIQTSVFKKLMKIRVLVYVFFRDLIWSLKSLIFLLFQSCKGIKRKRYFIRKAKQRRSPGIDSQESIPLACLYIAVQGPAGNQGPEGRRHISQGDCSLSISLSVYRSAGSCWQPRTWRPETHFSRRLSSVSLCLYIAAGNQGPEGWRHISQGDCPLCLSVCISLCRVLLATKDLKCRRHIS